MRAARRFIVSGQVQGVGFRYFVKQAAKSEDLQGWVRNLPDGRVEAYAEGDAEALNRLQRSLQRGPASAHVARVVSEQETPAGVKDFEIR